MMYSILTLKVFKNIDSLIESSRNKHEQKANRPFWLIQKAFVITSCERRTNFNNFRCILFSLAIHALLLYYFSQSNLLYKKSPPHSWLRTLNPFYPVQSFKTVHRKHLLLLCWRTNHNHFNSLCLHMRKLNWKQ